METNIPMMAVVPILIGPLQVLIALLPALLAALGGALLAVFKPRFWRRLPWVFWRTKWLVLGAVLVVLGIRWLARPGAWAGAPARALGARTAGDAWPMFGGGVGRTFTAEPTASPLTGDLHWVFRPSNEAFYATPAIVGSRVYITSAQLGITSRGGRGQICALDADTGVLVWSARPKGYWPTFSSPVVDGDYLVVGEGLHAHVNARVICLNRHTGDLIWEYRTRDHVECTPVIADGRVFVGAGMDGIYAFDLRGDGRGGARVLWHAPGDRYVDAETSLLVHEGRVYAGLGNGGEALVVLDAETGRELARLPFPYPVFSPPSISDDLLLVGMGIGDFVQTAASLGRPPSGQLVAVDLHTLTPRWIYPVSDTILGAPAARAGVVYVGVRDGWVHAVDRSGRLIWKQYLHGPILSSPAVTTDHVYVATQSGVLFILNAHTGDIVQQHVLGTGGLFLSSPVIARDRIYIGTPADGLICMGSPVTSARIVYWAAPMAAPGLGRTHRRMPLPPYGDFLWNFSPSGEMGDGGATRIAAPPATDGRRIYLPLSGAEGGLVALAVHPTGSKSIVPLWSVSVPQGVHHTPAVATFGIFFVAGRPGDAGRAIYRLDPETGRILWTHPLTTDAAPGLTVCPNGWLVRSDDDGWVFFDDAGRVQWSFSRAGANHAPVWHRGLWVFATSSGVCAVDDLTGRTIWEGPLGGEPRGQPVVDGMRVLIPTTRGVEALSLLNGSPCAEWRVHPVTTGSDLVLWDGAIAVAGDAGGVFVLDRSSGILVSFQALGRPGSTPMAGRDALLIEDGDRLFRWVPSEPPTEFFDARWLGKRLADPILIEDLVLISTDQWGLVAIGVGR